MGKLIMVRHGESEGNRDRRFNISPDIPITELGRKQAQETAERIARMFRPEAIIASPYLRARQTAEIIAEPLGLPVEVVHDLHERDLGSLKGESYDVLRDLRRNDPAFDRQQGWLWKPEGGESYDDVRRRVMVAIEGLRERYPEHEVVVVSHGGVMLSMWAHLVGRWKDAHLPPNCGIVIVEHDRDRFHPPKIVEP
jgi:broad specificity phosphatase PhoE